MLLPRIFYNVENIFSCAHMSVRVCMCCVRMRTRMLIHQGCTAWVGAFSRHNDEFSACPTRVVFMCVCIIVCVCGTRFYEGMYSCIKCSFVYTCMHLVMRMIYTFERVCSYMYVHKYMHTSAYIQYTRTPSHAGIIKDRQQTIHTDTRTRLITSKWWKTKG